MRWRQIVAGIMKKYITGNEEGSFPRAREHPQVRLTANVKRGPTRGAIKPQRNPSQQPTKRWKGGILADDSPESPRKKNKGAGAAGGGRVAPRCATPLLHVSNMRLHVTAAHVSRRHCVPREDTAGRRQHRLWPSPPKPPQVPQGTLEPWLLGGPL